MSRTLTLYSDKTCDKTQNRCQRMDQLEKTALKTTAEMVKTYSFNSLATCQVSMSLAYCKITFPAPQQNPNRLSDCY